MSLKRGLVAVKLSPTVADFALAMDRELLANVHKGEWQQWVLNHSAGDVLRELEQHFYKLRRAVLFKSEDGIDEHAADVGNIAMMLRWALVSQRVREEEKELGGVKR